MSQDPKTYIASDGLLNDHVILITGASDGIGRALALETARLGARVVLHGRDVGKLETVYDEIVSSDSAASPSILALDLASADSAAYLALAGEIEKEFGRLDGLVHNAGILGKRLSIEQYDPAEWQTVLHVNLTAAFMLTAGAAAARTTAAAAAGLAGEELTDHGGGVHRRGVDERVDLDG